MRNRIANGEDEMEKRQPTRATKYNVANEQKKEGPGSEFGSRVNLAKEDARRKRRLESVPPWIEVSTDRTYLVKPTDVGLLKLKIQPCDAKAPAPNERGVEETNRVIPKGDSPDSSEEEFGPDSKERCGRTWDVYGYVQ